MYHTLNNGDISSCFTFWDAGYAIIGAPPYGHPNFAIMRTVEADIPPDIMSGSPDCGPDNPHYPEEYAYETIIVRPVLKAWCRRR